MGLLRLHIVMIGLAAVFGGAFSARAFLTGQTGLGMVSTGITGCVAAYLVWFSMTKSKRVQAQLPVEASSTQADPPE